MRYDNLEDTLRSFPHWYDKNPNSNFYRVTKILNNQYLDKYHKIKSLDYARRLVKPIRIHKEQDEPYKYTIIGQVIIDNLKKVNLYINPIINDKEEIFSYEKCFTHDFKDDGLNNAYNFTYDGDSRYAWTDNTVIGFDDIEEAKEENYLTKITTLFDATTDSFLYNTQTTTEEPQLLGGVKVTNIDNVEGRVYSANKTGTGSNTNDWTAPFTVEGEIITGDGTVRLQLLENSTSYATRTLSQLRLTNGGTFRITYDGETVNYYSNDILRYSVKKSFENPVQIRFYLPIGTSFTYDSFTITTNTENNANPLIPNDNFIIEAITYDDYRWIKGYPENDSTDLFRIYQEDKSYTKYLTFEIKKENIKDISIYKDDELIKYLDLFNTDGTGTLIYHDYLPKQAIEEYDNVLVSEPSKDKIILRVILADDDYDVTFDYSTLETIRPSITDYEYVHKLPSASSETLDKIHIVKEYDDYNAYETITDDDDGYYHRIIQRRLRHKDTINHNYDLVCTLYDTRKPNCPQYDKVISKRYNGYDKSNEDCFTHDYSLDMIGKYWNVPRLEFRPNNYSKQYATDVEYYENTLPSFNNALTEDDYHYQERIKEYIFNYNKVHFPVLELWKNYGVWSKIESRKDILSVQDHSYLNHNPSNMTQYVVEQSSNKTNIVEGLSNQIDINNHIWYEAIICDDLYVVPKQEYHISYTVETDTPISDNERCSYHIYYFDHNDNCINEEVYTPEHLESTSVNSYTVDDVFITRENAYKVDIIIEYDQQFQFNNVSITRQTLVHKTEMYMKTKKDYHSCVYDLKVDYGKIPSNIIFGDTGELDKLLQRSLPLSHIGYLNIHYDEEETMYMTEDWGEITLISYFDETVDNGENDNSYTVHCNSFINPNSSYHLSVTFTDNKTPFHTRENDVEDNYCTLPCYYTTTTETINGETVTSTECSLGECSYDDNGFECPQNNSDGYIVTTLKFFTSQVNTPNNPSSVIELDKIKSNNEVTLHKTFTPPNGAKILHIEFETTDGSKFKYSNLSLTRDEPITKDEIWYTN